MSFQLSKGLSTGQCLQQPWGLEAVGCEWSVGKHLEEEEEEEKKKKKKKKNPFCHLGGKDRACSGLLEAAASGGTASEDNLFQLLISLYQRAGICMGLKS